MGCNCITRTYGNPPEIKIGNCLCVNDLRVGCDNGPNPCGGVFAVDLKIYNNVTASPCAVNYILKGFDTQAFDSVTLTSDGLLSVVTSSTYVKNKEGYINYKVDSPCSLLSDSATVYICMKDLCKGVECTGKCNPCDATCFGTTANSNVVASTCGGSGNFDINALYENCTAVETYTIKSVHESITSAVVNSTGTVSYSLPSPIAPGSYPIVVEVNCAGLLLDVTLVLQVPDLCEGVAVLPTEVCDSCTGTVIPRGSDIGGSKVGIGSVGSPNGTGFSNSI